MCRITTRLKAWPVPDRRNASLSVAAICLSVCLFPCQRPDLLDDRGRRLARLRRGARHRTVQGRRRPAFPAQLQVNRPALAAQRHIVDQEPEHPLPLAHRRPRIMPHARQIAREGVNAGAVLARERRGGGRRGAPVLLLGRRQPQQRLIPLALETVRDQAVFGTHEQKLPLGQLGLLAGAVHLRAAQPIDVRLARS
jgi:hypothetical protein